jgi:predicted RND superfamily exporter protein
MRVRWVVAWLLVAVAVPAAILMTRLKVDNRLERWTGANADARQIYDEFKATFGSDEFVVIALTGVPLFEPESLDAMMAAAGTIEGLPGIRQVRGLPIVYRDLLGAEYPELLAEEMLSTPFYRGLLISEDGTAAGLFVEVEPEADPQSRRRIMTAIESACKSLDEHGFQTHFVGSTALIVALDELSVAEARRSFAVALLCSLAVLAMLLRSVKAMAVAAVCSAVSVVLTLALVVVSGRSLNMITSVLPALLWVLSLSGAIHVVRRIQHHRTRVASDTAVAAALAETTRPCVLSAVTTALGFGSLAVATMTPVRELGTMAGLGILLSAVINLSVAPMLLDLLRVPGRAGGVVGARLRGAILGLGASRPRLVLALTLVAMAASIALVPRIRVASNPLSFLPDDHRIHQDYQWVGDHLTGFYTMETVMSLPLPWTDPRTWPVIDKVTGAVSRSRIVARVLSPLDVLRKLNQWDHAFDPGAYTLPAERSEAEALIAELGARGRDLFASLVAPAGDRLRLSALVNEMDEGQFLELVDSTRSLLTELPAGYCGVVTGQVHELVVAQQNLIRAQLESLGLAFLVVFAVMAIGLRSIRLTAVAVVPNLLPLAAAFIVMVLLDIALDAATVMMASVALGIAVDDTVHLLVSYSGQGAGSAPVRVRVRAALDRVASAMVATTATASIGFLALCTSTFVPISAFGLLAAVAMLVALASDLVLMPAILVTFANGQESSSKAFRLAPGTRPESLTQDRSAERRVR